MQEVIRLPIDGNPQKPEELLAEKVGPGAYRLLVSPGFVLGLAAGDVITLAPNGEYRVSKRGGNVCLQVFARTQAAEIEAATTPTIIALGGRLDGFLDTGLIVYTVPVGVGFPAIERVMATMKARWSGAEWYYGNVYDSRDGVTPLNWWKDSDG